MTLLDASQWARLHCLLAMWLGGSTACTDADSADADGRPQEGPAGRWTLNLDERAADPFPRRFVNLSGDRYEISAAPRRIASATLFTDVVLLAICPLDRIAALHEVSLKPMFSPVAAASQSFPRHITTDPESIRVLQPDLVFLASFSDKRTDRLVSGAGCPVIRLHGLSSISGVQQSIRSVGYITGLDAEAEKLVAAMQQRLDVVAAGGARRRGWRVISWESGFVAGSGTIFDDVLRCVGAVNAAAADGFEGTAKIGSERLLEMGPDAVVIGVLPGKEEEARQRLNQRSGMRHLAAVQQDRILFVPNHLLMSASHHVAHLAESIAEQLDGWDRAASATNGRGGRRK